jgi:hypothetical protein
MPSLVQFSKEIKQRTILLLVRELIKNSQSLETKNLLKERKEKEYEKLQKWTEQEEKKLLREKISRPLPTLVPPQRPLQKQIPQKQNFKRLPPQFKLYPKRNLQTRTLPPILRIPEPTLPPPLRYIKPIPKKYPIPLGALTPLMDNPTIQVIECNGPDKEIVIRSPQTKLTEIKLSKEEIERIINGFSRTSGIPLHDGLNTFVVGELQLSTIKSDLVDSKFILKKIKLLNPNMRRF